MIVVFLLFSPQNGYVVENKNTKLLVPLSFQKYGKLVRNQLFERSM